MFQTVASPEAGALLSPFRDEYIQAYRWMLLARTLDEKFAGLYRAGKIHGGVFLGRGQEALSVSIGLTLRKGDVFAPLICVVNGMLFARRFKGVRDVAGVASIGDGATSTGSFHEALNQAAVEKLPLVLVVANNQYAYSTPVSRQFACRNLVDKAIGYGIEGHTIDGTDLAACLKGVGEAVNRARKGSGPQLVVARLLRLCGHGEHDDSSYVDPKLKQSSIGRDCLKVAEEQLLQQRWADAAALEAWRGEAAQIVEEAVATVQREPAPDPYQEDWGALSSVHLLEAQDPPPLGPP